MRRFYCGCGQEVFFESSYCTSCGQSLGYDPQQGRVVMLAPGLGEQWQVVGEGRGCQLCGNRRDYGICNAIVAVGDESGLCLACRLNRTIPDISKPQNLVRWGRIEQAKRRLLFGLLTLGLPLEAPVAGYPRGLSFDFLEDQRSNPDVPDEFVTTGHFQGVITINVLEADDVQRVWQREVTGERYRTVLGHLRHEAGHYYFELLMRDWRGFIDLFGATDRPYKEVLEHYYTHGPLAGWEKSHISAYASAHPQEDWAECFAHYLHMIDTLETASARRVIPAMAGNESIDQLLSSWDDLAATINELNLSLGLRDAYPFVVTPMVADKLRFIDATIRAYHPNINQ